MKKQKLEKPSACYGNAFKLDVCYCCAYHVACYVLYTRKQGTSLSAMNVPIPSNAIPANVETVLSHKQRMAAKTNYTREEKQALAQKRAAEPTALKRVFKRRCAAVNNARSLLSRVFDDEIEYDDRIMYSFEGEKVCVIRPYKRKGVQIKWYGSVLTEVFAYLITKNGKATPILNSGEQKANGTMQIKYLKEICAWTKGDLDETT